ncbi:MAG: hypothetical protein H6810_08805 [Phycisphaeraceae bacterium]|nr:MAG: hypothetical protein H6810_08805 [Phycisphaeraceae bacterium]
MKSSAIVCLALAAGVASAQWTDDPTANTPVVVKANDQDVARMAVAPDGSSWTGWYDFEAGGITVRVQRLDADGNQTFGPDGLLVSNHAQNTFVVGWDLGVDAAGNVMLTFVDIRAGGDNDVYAYLIAPDGTFLWGPDGVAISDNSDYEANPVITQLIGGQYAVVWPRYDSAPGLYLQVLDASGTTLLSPGGIRIAGNGTEAPAFQEIAPIDDGDFILSFVRDTATFLSPRHVMAQKYGLDGTQRWGSAPVVVSNATSVPIAHLPSLVLDADQHAVIAWHDTRDGDFDCYVQRLDGSGNPVFVANGVAVSTELARQQIGPAVAVEPGGDVMVAFRNLDGAQNIQGLNVQRIDGDGVRALGNSGVVLLPYDNQYNGTPLAVSDAGGIAILTALEPNSSVGNFDDVLKLLRVDASGALIDGAPIDLATTASQKFRLNFSRTPDGGYLVAWDDDRNGNQDIYAQKVNADGSLGGSGCLADLTGDGILDLADVQLFISSFIAGNLLADVTGDGILDLADVQLFVASFVAGCP